MPAPTAAIYFQDQSGAMAKDLAARVRNDGVKTLMVWGKSFRDARDLEGAAKAVIIQKSLRNSTAIADAYARYASGVEIHFVDDDGEFIGADDTKSAAPERAPTPEPEPDTVVEANTGGGDEPTEAEADTTEPAATGDSEESEAESK